jgi:ParB family chromosome partitioning protein
MVKQKRDKKVSAGSKKRKKLALGKGLDALLPGTEPADESPVDYMLCAIDRIHPNPYQPRTDFQKDELEELQRSIEVQGILQPLLVRKKDGGFELVAGERRLRAARKAGLQEIPVVIKDVTDAQLLEMSIVENIQRAGLNPIEESEAYHRLMEEFQLTQDQAAERVGKSRSAVANFLRLRQLPNEIKTSVAKGEISMGHARPLLGLEKKSKQIAAWRTIVAKNLSAREAERLVHRLKSDSKKSKNPSVHANTAYFHSLAEDLSRHFGTKVEIRRKGKKGSLVIQFFSDDDLDRLLDLIKQG